MSCFGRFALKYPASRWSDFQHGFPDIPLPEASGDGAIMI
jgi:hypothetical protein